MRNPIVHFEMWSPDPETATAFYTSVFDWKINFTPQLAYWLVDAGAFSGAGGINGGMFKPQAGHLPAKIALYIQVDDVPAYLERAEAAGAKVLVGETEIPGVGWSAILLDPEDRAFGLFKPLAPPAAPAPAKPARRRPAKKKARAAASGRAGGRKAPATKKSAVRRSAKRPAKKK